MGNCVAGEKEERERRAGGSTNDSSQTLLSGGQTREEEEEEEEDGQQKKSELVNFAGDMTESLSRGRISTERGHSVRGIIRQGYSLKKHYTHPTMDFSLKLSPILQVVEEHISYLASDGSLECQSEADAIVLELLKLRSHLGQNLIPLSMKNAFYRERLNLSGGGGVLPQRSFRLDCIQFFEPLQFYGNEPGDLNELVKLYVFLLTETDKLTPFMTFYLERTCHSDEFYHCLCFFCEGNVRGQFHIYGDLCPSYWELRNDVLANTEKTIQHIVSGGVEPLPETICVTTLETPRDPGPINL